MIRRSIAFLLALSLTGCASQPTSYYRLTAPELQGMTVSPGTVNSQRVVRVRLPDYLNAANIAYQDSDVSVSLAQSNLWVEAPESAVARLLIDDLTKNIPQTLWQTDNMATSPPDAVVLVSLDQFNGRYDGHAVISGQWRLYDARQQLVVAYPIKIEVTQQGDGYPALTRALSEGVRQLARQIADQLPPIVVPK